MSVWFFPGQGIKGLKQAYFFLKQYPEILYKSKNILGYHIEEMLLEEKSECLRKTEYAQPLLYIINCCKYYECLKNKKDRPKFILGHSLGEYNALFAAEVFTFETGLKIVAERGRIMQHESIPGGMTAVIGMRITEIEQIWNEYGFDDLDIANINSNDQIVVAGPLITMKSLHKIFTKKHIRYVPLNVTRAFHSRYMRVIKDDFLTFLSYFNFSSPKIPIISNVTALPYPANKIKHLLGEQVCNQVKWFDSIKYLLAYGEKDFHEISLVPILSGIIRDLKKLSN